MKQLKYLSLLLGTIAVIGGLMWIVWVMIIASRPLLPPHGHRVLVAAMLTTVFAYHLWAVGKVPVKLGQQPHDSGIGHRIK
jgi:hypothetical protein